MPMPTIPGVPPETWELLLQIIGQLNTSIVELQEQGITTFEQLRQWLMLQGYELVEISEVVGYTVCKTTAVDPTTSNAVATRVATDIATTGGAGTAVAQFTSGGNRTLGLVTKAVAVGACLSLLVSTIGAGLVTDEVKDDLITSADPYTIDGENVPVLIDENGKTHFLDEMVEAIRAKAIELGIFDSGDFTPPESMDTDTDILRTWFSSYARTETVTVTKSVFNARHNGFKFTKNFVYSNGLIPKYIMFPSPSGTRYEITSVAYMYHQSGSNYYVRGYMFVDSNTPIEQGYGYAFDENGDSIVNGLSMSQFTGNGKTVTAFAFNYSTNNNSNYIANGSPELVYSSTSPYNLAYAYLYGTSGGGGVEGITPAQDLITAGVADATKPLTEVIPKLAEGEMSIASPTEDDLEHKSNWYPVSINSSDVFTDGATEDETSTAPDGDVKPDVEPSILDAIKELIEQLNPDGTPDVPVSDSGDTPPENPPLTPSSGANGSNGLWAIYNPTLAQVQQFGAWLWSDSLADQFKRIFNSPIDGVIGFHMLYCTPSRGAEQTIKCGFLESPVSSRTVASPYVEIDCGTVNIGEYYRNALDYDYTRISVYLPFIGIVPLDTNIVMGSSLNITYRVDVLTGTCLAQIKVIKENSDAVMYAFEGNCAVQIPLTATTYTGMVGALMSGVSAGIGVMTGNIAQAAMSGVNALANMYSGKSGVKQSGTMGANAGALGIRKPYVIITHPVAYMPVNFNKLEGLPSNITATLGSLTGFTRVRSVHLENIGTATQEEINMIEELLKEGVII